MKAVIEVGYKEGVFDASGEGIKKDIQDLGIKKIKSISTHQLYLLKGSLKEKDLQFIAQHILCDPVIQHYSIIFQPQKKVDSHKKHFAVEVWFKKGVTDNVGNSVKKAIEDLGLTGLEEVHTGRKFTIEGKLKRVDVVNTTVKLLANEVVEEYKIYGE